ncbi:tetratricopeptide repeat protein [Aquabacter sp. CN5-332]|uniref:tetratricopeptide repeat protein n=1 Tax=Aquabacter sp. CN5-332 TaxID=3156608 RepID=UPI0032B3E8AA
MPGSDGLIEAAQQFMASGRIEEADMLLDDVLSAMPGHVNALCLRASSLLARGQKDRAFSLLSELATQCPDRADIVGNLGMVHHMEGRGEEARYCYERAVALRPEEGAYRVSLATVLISIGEVAEAREQIVHLLDIGRETDNRELVAEARSLTARIALMGNALFEAEQALRDALELRPGHPMDLSLRSDVLARLQHKEEALALAEQVYRKAPADHDSVVLLARRLLDLNRFAEAERHLRRTVATAPNHVEANYLLATLLVLKGEGARALAGFAGHVRQAPNDAGLLMRMATLVRLSGDLEKALSFAELALKQEADNGAARLLRDDILLALGRIGEVWPEKPEEERSGAVPAITVPLALPSGDVLLLCRFASRLAPPGQRIVCHAEPDLLPLLVGISSLLPTDEPAQAGAVPITDLPDLLGVGEDPAAAPYLAVEEGRFVRWADAVAHLPRPLIGIVWDEVPPGLTLDGLVKMLSESLAGAGTVVSLVFDQGRSQLSAYPAIVDAGMNFTDSRDLAAAVAQLDLVVGSDGLAMHVAGALGREAVIAAPSLQPWVWAQRDGRSVWYPTIQVVRQPAPGSWDTVLATLASVVREKALGTQEP